MRVACPDCTTPVDANPGEEVVCPACMTRFTAPDSAQVPRRFDLHLPDGTVLPRLTLHAVREAIYVGRIPIQSRMRPDVGGEDLLPVYGYPPFGQVYSLLGIEPPTSAGTRRIAGWAGSKADAPTPPTASPVLPAIKAEERLRRFAATASLPLLLAMGVGVFFLLFGAVALYVSW